MAKENLIDKLHEADMLNFVLVSLFSADTLVDAGKSMILLLNNFLGNDSRTDKNRR